MGGPKQRCPRRVVGRMQGNAATKKNTRRKNFAWSLRVKSIKKKAYLVFKSSKALLQLKNLCPEARLCYFCSEDSNEDGFRSFSSPSRECPGGGDPRPKDGKSALAGVDSRSLRFAAAPAKDSFDPRTKSILGQSSAADISPALFTAVFRSKWGESADSSRRPLSRRGIASNHSDQATWHRGLRRH